MYTAQRVVEIRAEYEASGYLIAPGLVLTSWHVVQSHQQITVRIGQDKHEGTDAFQERTAYLLWPTNEPQKGFDFALLRIEPTNSGDAPVTWISLPTEGEIKLSGIGFPNLRIFDAESENTIPRRDTHEVHGVVSCGTFQRQMREGTAIFELELSRKPLNLSSPEDWGGMSGAALFAGNYLAGIVTKAYDNRILGFIPVSRLFEQEEVDALLTVNDISPPRRIPRSHIFAISPRLIDLRTLNDPDISTLDMWQNADTALTIEPITYVNTVEGTSNAFVIFEKSVIKFDLDEFEFRALAFVEIKEGGSGGYLGHIAVPSPFPVPAGEIESHCTQFRPVGSLPWKQTEHLILTCKEIYVRMTATMFRSDPNDPENLEIEFNGDLSRARRDIDAWLRKPTTNRPMSGIHIYAKT
jgi:hypothetical protein